MFVSHIYRTALAGWAVKKKKFELFKEQAGGRRTANLYGRAKKGATFQTAVK
jgi:hypothetical protein